MSGEFAALYSLIGDNTGAVIDSIEGNIIGTNESPVDPQLLPLANYGGALETHRPLQNSPVIDAGDPDAEAGMLPTPDFDGRDGAYTRVFDGDGDTVARIDIGAYEADEVYYIVDTLLDELDGDTSFGDFSLREAIEEANNLLSGTAIILFDPSLSGGTIELDFGLGQMFIAGSVEIVGLGAGLLTIDASTTDTTPGVIDGNGTRVFSLDDGFAGYINVKISGVTITGGDTLGGGGAIHSGNEKLVLENSVITGNGADWGGGLYSFDHGQLAVRSSEISGNTATLSGGGIYNYGGRVTVEQSTIDGNVAPQGGGISNNDSPTYEGFLTVRQSTISGNHVTVKGGGILNEGISSVIEESTVSGNTAVHGEGIYNANAYIDTYASVLEVIRSTITGNVASGYGGGVFDRDAVTYLIDSTLHNNSASYGGGLYADIGEIFITQTTISGNTASEGGGGVYNWRALIQILSSTITLNEADAGHGSGVHSAAEAHTIVVYSIIAGNLGTDVDQDAIGFFPFESNGHNLIGTGDATEAFVAFGDITEVEDPLLASLADNGGPTMTHALLEGSLAIDGTDVSDGEFDQRGEPFARAVDGDGDGNARQDIGAFELQEPLTEPGGGVPSGDYNLDGSTDAADYVMWRKLFGTTNGAPYETADGDGDLEVGPGDYDVWTEHFGETGPEEVGSGGGAEFRISDFPPRRVNSLRIVEAGVGQAVPDIAISSAAIEMSGMRQAKPDQRTAVRERAVLDAQQRDDGLLDWWFAHDVHDDGDDQRDVAEPVDHSADEGGSSAESLDEFFAALGES